jgi:hypothetical protein
MRRIWWFAIGGGVVLVAFVAALGYVFFTSDESEATGADRCPPAVSTKSAGNAQISARALGKGLNREIVVRARDKESGVPLRGATVTVQASMTCPHFMPLLDRPLREVSSGTYRGDYSLIMEGQWAFSIVVRSREGEATTSGLPLKVKRGE